MLLRAVVYLIVAFLLGPLAVIVLFSFHSTPALSFPFEGFSLRWYADLIGNGQLLAALGRSLLIASATAVITLVLGAFASLAWLRLSSRGKLVLELMCIIPIAMPALFIGVALLVGFAQIRLSLSLLTIILGHVVLTLPMLMVAMRAKLALFDPSLEDAARDLGAGTLETFWRVTLPLAMPTLVASTILSFAVSFDEFVVTSFVSGTETTLPLFIWSMMRRTVTPLINAVSTLALLFSVLLLVGAVIMTRIRRATMIDNAADGGN
ncbi:polyamine ABC transporter permease [Ensifer sp. Root31]|uniref:ABC transporter permease n=1 Tax=Ensifer sp. Root31 TaxID=1736512 RepID=UPI00070CCAE3|nr:ABC transporter permease [Ensifer sp. Root31]KQU86421.1 polyamine ABC transporter permease [Ensifer sp. Root31]